MIMCVPDISVLAPDYGRKAAHCVAETLYGMVVIGYFDRV